MKKTRELLPPEYKTTWDNLDDEMNDITISKTEMAKRLDEIMGHIERSEKKNKVTSLYTWRWLAAAAVLLIAVSLSWALLSTEIKVPAGEHKLVTLADGTVVTINSGSSLSVSPLFNILNRSVQLDGEAFFDVQKGDGIFKVETDESIVSVLGTEFNVSTYDHTEVTVSEGVVKVTNKISYEDTTLVFGMKAIVDQSKLSVFSDVDTEPIVAWIAGDLWFQDSSIMAVMGELQRKFGVRIEVKNKGLLQSRISAIYKNPTSVESIIADICTINNATFSEVKGGYIIE